jgi:hypothetical protein|nr:MAG TPA: hypothetical protein [Caudoviricetes sp.]
MFTVALVYGGGEGYSAFMVVLPALHYNGFQRSFDSLQTVLVRETQGKDQVRRHIAKM